MILIDRNAPVVLLQAYALQPDGQPKLDVVGGTVRVYHVVGGVEVVDLTATALGHPHTNVWRLAWAPGALLVAEYVAEFVLTDADGVTTRFGEDVIVKDYAQQSTLLLVGADVALIKQVETGRWKIAANQMIFYDESDVEILRFDLRNDAGLPDMANVFERVPV
jgi:hypothetical protein